MANDEKKPEGSRARKELDFGAQIYETFLDSLAEVLALRVTAREAGRQIRESLEEQPASGGGWMPRFPRGSELRDLAFDLAQLQVQNLRELTKIGRNHTEFLRSKLHEREAASEQRADRSSRREVLLCPELDQARKAFCCTFEVVNATSSRGMIRFPKVLTFRSSDGSRTCFAEPRFEPDHPVLATDAGQKVSMAIDRGCFPDPGTYLVEAPVSLGAERTLELFIQVVVPSGA